MPIPDLAVYRAANQFIEAHGGEALTEAFKVLGLSEALRRAA